MITTVEGGHRAILFSRLSGVQKKIYVEGIHFRSVCVCVCVCVCTRMSECLPIFRIPWLHYPIIFDIRARPKLLTSPTGSKDLQMVNMGLRVLFRPQQSELPSMYRQLGLDYDERVLPSICNEVS